jgi:hypothetical protein
VWQRSVGSEQEPTPGAGNTEDVAQDEAEEVDGGPSAEEPTQEPPPEATGERHRRWPFRRDR